MGLYDYFRLLHVYVIERNKVSECYSYLKLMIEAHLHVNFLAIFYAKRAPSGLKQFLATESPLKVMKSTSYFTLTSFFVFKIIKFLSWFLCHVGKRLD